ncbi:TRAP transporter small permease [Hydrogenophaga sp. PBL-H3]|uniref:TRAP transporter small permease n=1 Tax=Hydrogenophaga sp. PBL-H3 TaxID=434010 RepID=UPI0013203276|nr:TRAP transporter small permease [Hydrogenophaga sp. PBL-H3]QHE77418.1 TRAP transporter small permease [Hydrogenophaga sp. PBL-H3]QHE81842.1 TRAP transporter small permease [Hydrogenophaga sp. PBL-H3]
MKRVFSAIETMAALSLLLIAVLTAGNVLLRYAFSMQIPDWFDGSQMLQGIAMFWGIALATYYGTHICVDLLWESLKPAGQRCVDMIATAVTTAFLMPMAWMVWVKVGGTGSQGTMDLRLPLQWFYAVAAVGASVAALLALVRLVHLWQGRAASADEGSDELNGAAHGS